MLPSLQLLQNIDHSIHMHQCTNEVLHFCSFLTQNQVKNLQDYSFS